MKTVINILLYIWQLPQSLLGMAVSEHYKWDETYLYRGKRVIYLKDFRGGVSLGQYILISHRQKAASIRKHEYGHCRQSIMLGPLYLPVIGAFSGIHNLCHRLGWAKGDYYKYWTEHWADRLGNIKRDI